MTYRKFYCHICKRWIYFEGGPDGAIQNHWWNSHTGRGRVAPNPGKFKKKAKKTVQRYKKRRRKR